MNEDVKITENTITVGDTTFELVDYVPLGYYIWNIGKNMPDGFLPLCRLKAVQPFAGGRSIETDTLKAIRIEGAQIILAAVGGGQYTIDDMEKYISKHQNARKGTWHYEQVRRIKAALPIMKQIKWPMTE